MLYYLYKLYLYKLFDKLKMHRIVRDNSILVILRREKRGHFMAISYNNLWKLLIDKEMNKAKISKGTMAKMTNNEPVTLTVIEKICDALQCDIGDVVQIADVNKDRR